MPCNALPPSGEEMPCWHSEGHKGDHGREYLTWPNADDPYQVHIAELQARLHGVLVALTQAVPKALKGAG